MPNFSAPTLAIVGIGCRLPGGIESPRDFWSAVSTGRNSVTEIPVSRWSRSAFYHPDPAALGSSYSRWAGLVEKPDEFDAEFFSITPREARRLDPQQRWFLEVVWRALEDAGQRLEDLRRRPIGVFVGCSSADYGEIQRHWRYNSDLHTNTGAAVSLIANRVSHAFDLRGPSLVVDTACSSALVALDLAARAIGTGQCSAALVGGVNALFMPEATIGFAKASMLAKDGKCKAFDERADGYVRAEGAIALLLKPLETALEDGDRIYASVLSTAVNQDGEGPGITVPSESQQRQMLVEAYEAAGVDPLWVGGVEAHGTGTPVGDPIEARALGRVLGVGRGTQNPLLLGSVKTNLGHLEPASGAAGLAKLALSLSRRQFAPSLHFRSPSPEIDFAGLGLRVSTSLRPWPAAPDGRCYGGVNSFGFGGTNAHAVLCSAPEPVRTQEKTRGAVIWPLSARSLPALQSTFEETAQVWQQLGDDDLRGCAAAQACRRTSHPYRFALVAESPQELREAAEAVDLARVARRAQEGERRVLFIFSGQGGQWHGMARDLPEVGPAAAQLAEQIDQLMPPVAGRSLLQALCDPDPGHADRTDVIQPLLFLQQLMLAAQLDAWGVRAAAVCGHSVGEVAAAYWSGALTLADAVTVIHHRSRLQERTRGSGAMAAVGLSAEAIAERLVGSADLCIAAINAPDMVTVAGDAAELARLCRTLEQEGAFVRGLDMPYAFHSPHMDDLRDEMERSLSEISARAGDLPFISTVTGGRLNGNGLGAEYWWRNLREPVRFRDAIVAACSDGCDVAIELGPQPSLLKPAAAAAAAAGCSLEFLPTLRRERPASTALTETLGQAWALGLDPDWSKIYPGKCGHRELPVHPWRREGYWLEAPVGLAYRTWPVEHPLLGRRVYGPGARWEQMPDPARVPDLADHRVRGDIVFPGTGYVEQMLAVGAALFGDVPVSIGYLELERVLVLDSPRLMQIERDPGSGRVQIWSETGQPDEPWVRHAHARLLPSSAALAATFLPAADAGTLVSVEGLYRRFDDGGNHYGPRFRCIREVRTNGDQAWGRIALDPCSAAEADKYRFHPALLDAALQMVLELLRRDDMSELYLPLGVDRIEVTRQIGSAAQCLVRNARRCDGILSADIFIFDETDKLIALLLGCRCRAIENRSEAVAGPQAYGWAWHEHPAEPARPAGCAWRLWGFCEDEARRLGALVGSGQVGVLGEPGPIDDTVVCWFRSNGCDAIADAREAVLALARCVQELAPIGAHLVLVTEGATWGHGDAAAPNIALSGVWALGRSLVTERPLPIAGIIDLEPGTALADAVEQIGAGLGGTAQVEIAWRGACCFEHRLERRPPKFREKSIRTEECPAFGLGITEPGSLGALRWERRAIPQPGPGQVAVAVEAAGLNFRDVLKALDLYPLEDGEWRWFGDECAGTVVELGAGVTGLALGQPVVAVAPDCMATHVVADGRLVVPRPAAVTPEIAAGVPIAFLTAWYSLIDCGRLREGETVLVHAAAGGVGQAAIQIARRAGARVLATASPEKQALVAALGADAVFNSRDLAFPEAVRSATGGQGVDLVLNSLAAEALLHGVDLLKPFGRFVEIGKRDIYGNRSLDLRSLRDNRAFSTVDIGSWIARRPEEAGGVLRQILALIESGALRPVQTQVHSFRGAPDAFRAMSQGSHTGKLVFQVSADAAPAEVADPKPQFVRGDATYLISGGTSGLGLVVAQALAGAGARHLVLVSRSGRIGPAEEGTLGQIERLGAAVHLRRCDVAEREGLEELLDDLRRKLPPLRGIVHGAAVLDDVSALELDRARLDRVLMPKAQGAWNLSVTTEGDPLDWFLMHGSVAATLGSPGQANYVVANHLMDALAENRRCRGLPGQIVAWGPVAEAGMVARSERLRRYFDLLGFVPLTSAAMADGTVRMLRSQETSLAIAQINWPKFAAAMPAFDADSRFAGLLALSHDTGGSSVTALRAANPQQRRRLLAKIVCEQIAAVLGVVVARVDGASRLADLGLDSLMTFELSAGFEAKIGARLPLSTLQANHTVDELVEVLDRSFARPDRDAPEAPARHAPVPAPVREEDYLGLRFLPADAVVDPEVSFDAAALTYIPDGVEIYGGLGISEIRAAFGDTPFLTSLIDSPLGRVGTLMLPLRGRDLFYDRNRTVALVKEAMMLAAARGARVTTLTGLLPAATAYGASVQAAQPVAAGQSLTTGHALTTAVIVAELVDLLERCGRSLSQEAVAVVGLGSVGRSVIELMLRVLPHPRSLVLCDLYKNQNSLSEFRVRIGRQLGFGGHIEIVAGDDGLPQPVLDSRFIVAAVDRTDLIDPWRLRPGTILLDDSYPAAFAAEAAWARMEERGDVVIASGGFARLPGPVRETLYVPASARAFVEDYGRERFLDHFRREPSDYTACVFAGPLSLADELLPTEIGVPTPAALQNGYAALQRHRIGPAPPQCGGRAVSDQIFANIRRMPAHG